MKKKINIKKALQVASKVKKRRDKLNFGGVNIQRW